jgi:hypothetical protein
MDWAIVFNRVLGKMLSVRVIVTLMLTATFCAITYKTVDLFFANIGNKEAIGTIEKVAMFMLGSFCTQMANILTSYFSRTDRGSYLETESDSNPTKEP